MNIPIDFQKKRAKLIFKPCFSIYHKTLFVNIDISLFLNKLDCSNYFQKRNAFLKYADLVNVVKLD